MQCKYLLPPCRSALLSGSCHLSYRQSQEPGIASHFEGFLLGRRTGRRLRHATANPPKPTADQGSISGAELLSYARRELLAAVHLRPGERPTDPPAASERGRSLVSPPAIYTKIRNTTPKQSYLPRSTTNPKHKPKTTAMVGFVHGNSPKQGSFWMPDCKLQNRRSDHFFIKIHGEGSQISRTAIWSALLKRQSS